MIKSYRILWEHPVATERRVKAGILTPWASTYTSYWSIFLIVRILTYMTVWQVCIGLGCLSKDGCWRCMLLPSLCDLSKLRSNYSSVAQKVPSWKRVSAPFSLGGDNLIIAFWPDVMSLFNIPIIRLLVHWWTNVIGSLSKKGITSDQNTILNCHLLTRMGQNSFPWWLVPK